VRLIVAIVLAAILVAYIAYGILNGSYSRAIGLANSEVATAKQLGSLATELRGKPGASGSESSFNYLANTGSLTVHAKSGATAGQVTAILTVALGRVAADRIPDGVLTLVLDFPDGSSFRQMVFGMPASDIRVEAGTWTSLRGATGMRLAMELSGSDPSQSTSGSQWYVTIAPAHSTSAAIDRLVAAYPESLPDGVTLTPDTEWLFPGFESNGSTPSRTMVTLLAALGARYGYAQAAGARSTPGMHLGWNPAPRSPSIGYFAGSSPASPAELSAESNRIVQSLLTNAAALPATPGTVVNPGASTGDVQNFWFEAVANKQVIAYHVHFGACAAGSKLAAPSSDDAAYFVQLSRAVALPEGSGAGACADVPPQ
jgi:hypothetical protein